MKNSGMGNSESLRHEVRDIWNQNADFWDERMGEGNKFHRLLIEPTQLRLLNLCGDELILDVACGNGQFARKMAELGATVIAVDAAERMIGNAQRRSAAYEGRIEYRVIDCTDYQQLTALGETRFNKIVCTMALMDMSEVQPLASASARLLKGDGQLVFSVLHPCFNYEFSKLGVEQHDIGGELVREYYVRTSRYCQPSNSKGTAMVGQPVPQYYFHRSLSLLLNTFFAEGFVLDALEEPALGELADESKLFDMVYQQIPPAVVARMRRLDRSLSKHSLSRLPEESHG